IKYSYIVTVLFFITGCEKTIELDLNKTEARVVIEGMVTNYAGYQYVKVSRTAGFYTDGATPRITDATVQLEADLGNTFPYIHNPGAHADSIGYYLPETPFIGEVGRTYTVTVVADGETYTASDKINRLVPIDKVEYAIDEEEQEDPEDPGRFYELLLYVK